MKHPLRIAAAATALLVIGAAGAKADCAQEIAALSQEGVSKDGSLAPLAGSGEARGGPSDPGEDRDGIAKDGSTAPLQDEGVADVGGPASAGDAQARQSQASEAGGDQAQRVAALERARAALDRGDEIACMEAVEDARAG
jgi:hypothetical protein